MKKLTKEQLRQRCKKAGIRNYSNITKDQMNKALNWKEFQFSDSAFETPRPERKLSKIFPFCDSVYEVPERKPNLRITEVESALESRLKTYEIRNNIGIKDPEYFLDRAKDLVLEEIRVQLDIHKSLKVNLRFYCSFKKYDLNSPMVIPESDFKTSNNEIIREHGLDGYYTEEKEKLLRQLSEFEQKDSGWTLYSVNYLELRINKYVPFRGSSYLKLPQWIENKKAVINVQNEDDKCFMWAVLSFLHPAKNMHKE